MKARDEHPQPQPSSEQPESLFDLVAPIAKDMRESISGMKGLLASLREHGATLDPDERKAALGSIIRTASQFEVLIKTLTELPSFTNGPIQIKKEDVVASGFVEEVIESAKPLCKPHKVILHIIDDVIIHMDPERIRQVLLTLISRAVTHGDIEKTIHIAIERTIDEAEISVLDIGPGMRPAAPAVHSSGLATIKDTGELSLYVCRNIALAHGGDLRVDPDVIGGIRLVISLPLHPLGEGGKPDRRAR